MSKKIREILFLIISVCIVIMVTTGCASAKQHRYFKKKGFMDTGSSCDLSHLGKNKYFYSHSYQRKIGRSERRIVKR